MTSVLSGLHRLSGLLLSACSVVLSLWLISLALGEVAYLRFMSFAQGWLGLSFLILVVFCLYYHLFNGVRHLLWDWGWGFSLERVYFSGWTVVAAALVCSTTTVVLVR